MIVLGKRYNFTKYELRRLEKQFPKINYIKYKDKNPNEVLEKLEEILLNCNCKILVLNTKAKIDDNIIKYLTNLQFNDKILKIISLEHFMEKYLHKCYIPDDHQDLNFLDDIKPFTTWQYIQKRTIDLFGVFWLLFFSWPVIIYARYKIKKLAKT